ncbi:MAG: outer membrane lipoprotein carrier protein LolA [Bacteriovoracaceae bacterium]
MKLIMLLLITSTSLFAKTFVPASFSANFEESFKSLATGKEKKSFGKIDYKYPGHIRFETTSPNPSLFVSNPQTSWYYQPPFVSGEEGQVTIQKSSKLPLTKFLDSVKNGIEGSKLFTHKYVGKDLILTFVKTIQKEMTLKEVTLHADKEAKLVQKMNEFEQITLIYTDGRKVNLKFIDLKEDVSFSSSHFVFSVPPKTKVTKD